MTSFQLTRPVWGEPDRQRKTLLYQQISTHSPRVGRTVVDGVGVAFTDISTHSPRVGRTSTLAGMSTTPSNFNSLAPCGANHVSTDILHRCAQFQLTRPVWGEPADITNKTDTVHISTHSPRVGRTLEITIY